MRADAEVGERIETMVCEGDEVAEAHVQYALMDESVVLES